MLNLSPRAASIVIGIALALSQCGCGGERPYPVRGQLFYEDNDQPVTELKEFTVMFTSEKLQKSSRGNIDENGVFHLSSIRDKDGAFPGDYKVTLTQPHPNPERGEFRKPVVLVAYENPQTTTLDATVEAKTNELTFKLKRIGKK
jgi:hypothetical protein